MSRFALPLEGRRNNDDPTTRQHGMVGDASRSSGSARLRRDRVPVSKTGGPRVPRRERPRPIPREPHSGCGLPRPYRRALVARHRPSVYDAAPRGRRGEARSGRRRSRQPRGRLQRRLGDVGDAALVDAPLARLRSRRRARRGLRQVAPRGLPGDPRGVDLSAGAHADLAAALPLGRSLRDAPGRR